MIEYREYITYRGSRADPFLELLQRSGPDALLQELATVEALSDYLVHDGEPWGDKYTLYYVEDESVEPDDHAEWVIAVDWMARVLIVAWRCETPDLNE